MSDPQVIETTETEYVVQAGTTDVVVIVEDNTTVIETAAEQGPPGPAGPAGAGGIELAFAWGDASPRTVAVATGGKLVYGVQLHIDTAFDGAGAALTVGDAGDPDRLMSASQNDPAAEGTYTSAPVHRYGSDTTVLLTITPGAGASAGAGLLTLFVEQ